MNHEFKIGDKVLFGRRHGEQTLGEVVKIGRSKIKVKQLESRGTMRSYPVGAIWGVPPTLMQKVDAGVQPIAEAPKRPEVEVLREVRNLYCQLSPENLTCDGELPPSAVRRRAQQIHARLRVCFQELGRVVTEDEAYQLRLRMA